MSFSTKNTFWFLLILFCFSSFQAQSQNQNPVITSAPVTAVNDGDPYRYEVTATDADGDVLQFSATGLPTWLTFCGYCEGTVTNLAGSFVGYVDGPGATAAFRSPRSLVLDKSGNIFLVDVANYRIRKITPDGVVSTLAGSTEGFADGTGSDVRFEILGDMVIDKDDNLYVFDSANERIRKITPEGVVSTFLGNGQREIIEGVGVGASVYQISSMLIDDNGVIYFYSRGNIYKVTPEAEMSKYISARELGLEDDIFSNVYLALHPDGSLVYFNNGTIKKISSDRKITLIAGTGEYAVKDGPALEASFGTIVDMAIDAQGNIFVADRAEDQVRVVSINGYVYTVAGNGESLSYVDGVGTAAGLSNIRSLVLDENNQLYVSINDRVKRVVFPYALLQGDPKNLAGTYNPVLRLSDGNGGEATQSFSIEVTDNTVPQLEKIIRAETLRWGLNYNNVSFEIGFSEAVDNLDISDFEIKSGGATGTITEVLPGADDLSYRLNVALTQANGVLDIDIVPGHDITDKAGNPLTNLTPLYEETYDFANQAPLPAADFPSEIFAGQKLNILLPTTDPENHNVEITAESVPDWLSIRPPVVSTLVGSGERSEVDGRDAPSLLNPTGSAIDNEGNLYVLGNNKIRKVTPDGYVTTLVGGESGNADGDSEAARFNGVAQIIFAPDGFLYVTEISNNKIRRVSLNGDVTTFAGAVGGGSADGDLSTASFLGPRAINYHDGKFYVSDRNGMRVIDGDGNVTTFSLLDQDSNPFTFPEIIDFAVDSDGSIFVVDRDGTKLYKIGTDLKVSLVAGSVQGDQDGRGLEAQFGFINAIELDARGNLYMGDATNSKIKRVDRQLNVVTIAGSGERGFFDGNALDARFQNLNDILYASGDYLVICDWNNRRVRKLELNPSLYGTVPEGLTNGTITTDLGLTDAFGAFRSITLHFDIVQTDKPEFGPEETVNFAEGGIGVAYQPNLTNPGNVSIELGESADGHLFLVDAANGHIFFRQPPDFENPADANTDNIYSIKVVASRGSFSAKKEISVVVTNINDNAPEFISESVTSVTDVGYYTYEIEATDADGDSLVFTNSTLASWLSLGRKTTNQVSTLAGSGQQGSTNEPGVEASFNNPVSVHYASSGDIFVAENGGNRIRKIDAKGNVTTVAGTGESSSFDGDVSSATLSNPLAVASDKLGNVYVVGSEHRLRKISPDGQVTTLAGNGQAGYQDGTGSVAQFNRPAGIVADKEGNLFVADQNNNRIRKVTQDGVVTTFAGSGQPGAADGTSTGASFQSPRGLAIDKDGNLYVADQGNHLIRKITSAGVVTTLAGATDGSVFNSPNSVAVDGEGNVYVGDFLNFRIKKVDTNGKITDLAGSTSGFKDGRGTEAQFSTPVGLSIDPYNNLYVADAANSRIRKLKGSICLEGDPPGQLGEHDVTLHASDQLGKSAEQSFKITVLNGAVPHFDSESTVAFEENNTDAVFVPALKDGQQAVYSLKSDQDAAQFTIDPADGQLRFASSPDFESPTDQNTDNVYNITIVATIGAETAEHNLAVSVINLNDNDPQFDSSPVTSVANNQQYRYQLEASDADGDVLTIAASNKPNWLELDGGSLVVTNLAGNGNAGLVNGTGTAASFNFAAGLWLDPEGNTFVADYDTHTIRKISPTGEVTTFAGSGNRGYVEGQGALASFSEPSGLAMDKAGNLFVADFNGHVILKITPSAEVSFFAGVPNEDGFSDGNSAISRFSIPIEITVDQNDNLYVADYNNHAIRKITPDGRVTTLAGSGGSGFVDGKGRTATFSLPSDMVVDYEGNVYVADGGNNAIRKITPTGVVTTLAGTGAKGFVDGPGASAQFDFPSGIDIDVDGSLLVADNGNRVVRRVTLDGHVSTILGSGVAEEIDGIGTEAAFKSMLDVVSDRKGGMVISTGTANTVRRVTLSQPALTGDATGQSGTHNVSLAATDPGGNQATQEFTITLTDATAPVFTSGSTSSLLENSTLPAYHAKADDTSVLSFSLGTNNDEANFEISSSSGLLFFNSPPDFENPTDANTDNVYEIEVKVSDGTNEASQMVSIMVTDLADESLAFTSTPQTEVPRQNYYQYVVEARQSNGASPVISTTDLPDWLSFHKQAKVTSIPGKGSYIASDGQGNFYTADLSRIWKIASDGTISVLAGNDQIGYQDGTGTDARFFAPQGLAVGPDGNLYVADSRNNRIRKVTPAGVVTTFAGKQTDGWEHFNGSLLEAAFAWPSGLVFGPSGNLFVADTRSHTIRKIGTDGQVTTVAGKLNPTFIDRGTGLQFLDYDGAYVDGPAAEAQFDWPWGISIDSNGNLFVTDRNNNVIRKVGTDGQVTTVLQNDARFGSEASYLGLGGITIDDQDNILITASGTGIFRITPSEEITQLSHDNTFDPIDGVGREVSFYSMFDIVIHNDDFIYVPDEYPELLRKISLVDVISGDPFEHVGTYNIKLTATDNSNSVDQDFTLTVKDEVGPKVLEILRAYPGEESVRTDQVTFKVNFSEPVVNVNAAAFDFDKAQILGQVSEVSQLNDSSYQVALTNIRGFGHLNLDFSASHSIQDANGVALSANGAEVEEEFVITQNTAPVFQTEPVALVADNETYRYPYLATDADFDSVSVTAETLPSWLQLNVSQYEVTHFAGGATSGFQIGRGEEARFNSIRGLAVDQFGTVYALSHFGNNIRKIDQNRNASGVFASLIRFIPNASGNGGSSPAARPNRILAAGDGVFYVSTNSFGTIEKVDARGNMVLLAGSEPGFVNGTGTEAQFNGPRGMALDAEGNLYVADTGNDAIRKITPAGVVTTYAGGTQGYQDGDLAIAKFNAPYDVALDAEGNLFVADTGNDRIRKISKTGEVTTVAGSGADEGNGPALESGFGQISSISFDEAGDLYILDWQTADIRVLDQNDMVTPLTLVDEKGQTVTLSSPGVMTFGKNGEIYVTEEEVRILKVRPLKELQGEASGQSGDHEVVLKATDQWGAEAYQTFTITIEDKTNPILDQVTRLQPLSEETSLTTVTFRLAFTEPVKNLDPSDFMIQSNDVTGQVKDVFQLAGENEWGATVTDLSGTGSYYLALKNESDIYDLNNNALDASQVPVINESYTRTNTAPQFVSQPVTRPTTEISYEYPIQVADADCDVLTVTSDGLPDWLSLTTVMQVSTLAGNGEPGLTNGTGADARFTSPEDVVIDSEGNIYVSDRGLNTIRKITPEGLTSNYTGSYQNVGFQDGTLAQAKFFSPSSLTIDQNDNIYLIDAGNYAIRKISTDGMVTTIAGGAQGYQDGQGTAARFVGPRDLVLDSKGNLYLFDTKSDDVNQVARLRKVDTNGNVTTVAGGEFNYLDGPLASARFHNPTDLVIDDHDNLFFSEGNRHVIRKISASGKVSTIAGTSTSGYQDGTANQAQFNTPTALAFDRQGDLIIAEQGNSRIRKMDKAGMVTTLAGNGDFDLKDGEGSEASFNSPFGLAVSAENLVIVADAGNHAIRQLYFATTLQGDPSIASDREVVTLKVSDGQGGEDTQTFTITQDRTAPVYTAASSVEVIEGTIDSFYTATATDDAELTYSLGANADEFYFEIGASNGQLKFREAPDFEDPQDADGDNEYVILIKATDEAGNSSEQTVTVTVIPADEIAPTVTITTEENSITNNPLLTFKVTISEAAVGFGQEDLTVTNATVSSFTQSGNDYEVTLEPTTDGAVSLQVPADAFTDEAGNDNTASEVFSLTSDRTTPEVVISTDESPLTNKAELTYTLTLSESPTGFTQDDLTMVNATLGEFTGDDKVYTVKLIPIADGEVKLSVAANTFTDAADNGNTASEEQILTSDRTAPVPVLSSTSSGTIDAPFTLTVTYNESVNDFSIDNLELENSAATGLTPVVAGEQWTLTITPEEDGNVVVGLPAGAAMDHAGNESVAATPFEITFDVNQAPTAISLSSGSVAENEPVGTIVGTFSAVDPDQGDTHAFSLVSGANSDDNASFQIDDDQLLTNESFDFETKSTYRIRVRAEDEEGASTESVVTISITNVAEPVLSLSGALDFGAVDIDGSVELSFTIQNDGDGELLVTDVSSVDGFAVNFTSGTIAAGGSQEVVVTFSPTENITYSGSILVESNAGSESLAVTGSGQLVTYIDDDLVEAVEISVYPNPARDVVHLDLSAFKGRPVDLQLVDAAGRVRTSQAEIRSAAISIDVGVYEEGLFLIRLQDQSQLVTKKLMIKR